MAALCLLPLTGGASSEPAGRYLSGWLPYWSATGAYDTVRDHAALFRSASPFGYTATGATSILSHPAVLSRAILTGLHARGIIVLPTVNTTLTTGQIAAIGHSATARAARVAALLRLVAGSSHDGLDLDYEHQTRTTSTSQAAAAGSGYDAIVTGPGRAPACRPQALLRDRDAPDGRLLPHLSTPS